MSFSLPVSSMRVSNCLFINFLLSKLISVSADMKVGFHHLYGLDGNAQEGIYGHGKVQWCARERAPMPVSKVIDDGRRLSGKGKELIRGGDG